MERKFWLLIPKEIKIRILYYSIKSPLNKNIMNEIKKYKFKKIQKTYNTYESDIRNRIRFALESFNY